ncbi:MAG: TolC family protein [Desulfuromusa sp.]|nr:TolC family protein [Desulfuromusa sp.]
MYFLCKFFAALLLLLAGFSLAIAQPVQLTEMLKEADTKNPSLRVAQERIELTFSQIKQETSLQDPIVSVSLLNYPIDSFKTNQIPMTGNEIRLAQKFPFPGKLDVKGKIAAKKSLWFSSAYQDARLQIRRQVKDAWYRLLFQRQAIQLTNRNLKIFDDFIKLTESRYEVGKGLQQNVLKAHLQRSQQLDKLLVLQQQEEATSAELNSLVGRDTGQPLEIDSQLQSVSKNFNLQELQEQATQNRPMFKAYAALIGQYKGQRKLAQLDYRPDFTLWAGYRWRDNALADAGTDFVSAGVSFNLPVRKQRRVAAVTEADSALRLAFQQRNNFHNQINLEIHQSLASFEQAEKLVELYQGGIIPQANQTFQATLSAYQVDKVDFLDLLDSLMTLYRYEIDFIKVLSDQQRSIARLEAAAGLEVEQLSTRIKG